VIIAILTLLIPQAMAFSDCHIQNADFLAPVETLGQLNLPLTAMAATPLIELLNVDGRVDARCTANVVSDAGTLMTAGHCVQACLERAGVFEKKQGISHVNQEKMAQVKCKIRVNGKLTEAEVLATNDCRGPAEWTNLSPKSCGSDFAFLKIKDTGVLGDAGCFHVGGRETATGAKVATIGYPYVTARTRLRTAAKDSDGRSQYVSYGETIPFTDRCLTEIDSDRGKPYAADMSRNMPVGLYSERVRTGATIQTNVDITKGNSGGGLIDQSTGEIVGIASSHVVLNQLRECKGASLFSSTREVREILARDYPRLDLGQTLRGEKKALVKTQRI
jgi:hypothetical protein